MAPRGLKPLAVLAALAAVYVLRKRKKAKQAAREARRQAEALARGEPLPPKKPSPMKIIWALIKPKKWFAPGKDGEGSRLMLTILLLAGARIVQISIQTHVVQVLDQIMNSRDIGGFKRYMVYSIVISLFGTTIRQVWNYASAHLVVLWRIRLTDRLHEPGTSAATARTAARTWRSGPTGSTRRTPAPPARTRSRSWSRGCGRAKLRVSAAAPLLRRLSIPQEADAQTRRSLRTVG